MVERVEGGGARVPELGLTTGRVVAATLSDVVLTVDGILDGGGPLLHGLLQLFHEAGVAADLLIRHIWWDFRDVNCNVSVRLLERCGDLRTELVHVMFDLTFAFQSRDVDLLDHKLETLETHLRLFRVLAFCGL